jgi:MFS family permease
MIQRIQSLYLLIAALVAGALSTVFFLWKIGEQIITAINVPEYIGLFGLSTVLSVITIFMYKTRKRQFMLGRLNIILNFVLLGLFVYRSLSLSGEPQVSEKGIGMFLPIISIVFIALANKPIKKDEDLVKSVDRLR